MSTENISGSWLGNYYYETMTQSFGFEAVFMEMNGNLEGSILDDGKLGEAKVIGVFINPNVQFTKRYGNSALNAVSYEGVMSDEGKKLSGSWQITGTAAKGTWLAWRQDEEKIPELETEDEIEIDGEENLEREKVAVRPMTQTQK